MKSVKHPHVLIREYIPSDKEEVLLLFRENCPDYFAPEEEKHLRNYLDHEREEYFVLELNARIVGCGGINFGVGGRTGIISWDMLHPDFHRMGLGSLLLKHRLSRLRNIHEVEGIIVRTSQLSWKFYQKSGFELREIIPDFWAKGFDLYRMEFVEMS